LSMIDESHILAYSPPKEHLLLNIDKINQATYAESRNKLQGRPQK
jgi:hypothetical protein